MISENGGVIDEKRYTTAIEGGYTIAVLKELTPELVAEGITRELVHRLQNLRRSADYNIAQIKLAQSMGTVLDIRYVRKAMPTDN